MNHVAVTISHENITEAAPFLFLSISGKQGMMVTREGASRARAQWMMLKSKITQTMLRSFFDGPGTF